MVVSVAQEFKIMSMNDIYSSVLGNLQRLLDNQIITEDEYVKAVNLLNQKYPKT